MGIVIFCFVEFKAAFTATAGRPGKSTAKLAKLRVNECYRGYFVRGNAWNGGFIVFIRGAEGFLGCSGLTEGELCPRVFRNVCL